MKIKHLEFSKPIFLSPMAGVGDFAFRALCREHGADFSFTEMISVAGLIHNSVKTKKLLFTLPTEMPCGVQLFGDNEEEFAQAVKMPELEKFDVIDINFGCPAPKIFKNNAGSALLSNPDKIKKIVTACVQNTSKPITCKIRLGIDDKSINAVQIAKICERAGASAITVHGRTKKQNYSGNVDYEEIAKVKAAVNIPVIGNGDVCDKESYNRMLQTGVDGVSLARASLGRPWIFNEVKGINENICVIDIIKNHVEKMRLQYDEKFLIKYFRKHLLWYLKNYRANELKLEICKLENLDEILKKIETFFQNY